MAGFSDFRLHVQFFFTSCRLTRRWMHHM